MDNSEDFAWLELVDQNDCFMPLDPSNTRPAKSLDFGQDGTTGSLAAWHELSQITAPDDACGIIFVRGRFPEHADAILARAQRRNDTGHFGLNIAIPKNNPPYVLERTPAEGLINLRWPYSRLNFVPSDANAASNFATATMCSFVKEGTVYQIYRVTPACVANSPWNSPDSSTSDLRGGCSPCTNETGNGGFRASTDAEAGTNPGLRNIKVDVGGTIRFGCPYTIQAAVPEGRLVGLSTRAAPPTRTPTFATAAPTTLPTALPTVLSTVEAERVSNNRYRANHILGPTQLFKDDYTILTPNDGMGQYVLACESKKHERRLEIRLWVNGKPVDFGERRRSKTEHFGNAEVVFMRYQYPFLLHERESTTFLASFRLVPTGVGPNWDATIAMSSADVEEHLGCAPKSIQAPYRLWSHLMKQSAEDEDDAKFAARAIGRCVEEVLGVLSVPVTLATCRPGAPKEEEKGLALVKTIIDRPVVDFESLLWHVRLLVMARQVIKAPIDRNLAPFWGKGVSRDDAECLERIRAAYLSLLEARMQGILRWIIQVAPKIGILDPGYRRSYLLLGDIDPCTAGAPERCGRATLLNAAPSTTDLDATTTQAKHALLLRGRRPQNQKWFAIFIVWYMIHLAPELLNAPGIRQSLRDVLPTIVKFPNNPDSSRLMASDDPFRCLVRSYHSRAVEELGKKLDIPTEDSGDWAKAWQARADKAIRLFGQGRFLRLCVGHEVANMAIITDELGFSDESLLSFIKERVRRREDTKVFMAGNSEVDRGDQQHIRSGSPRPAPWELSCLGHHLPLNLGMQTHAKKVLESCKEFLLADYTFVPSWDPSKASAVGLWWDLTASSIICTKLLHDRILSPTAAESTGKDGAAETKPGSVTLAGWDASAWIENQRLMIRLLEQINGKPVALDDVPGFNWRTRRPRLIHHADSLVTSLESSEDVYNLNQPKDVFLRPNIRKHLESRWSKNRNHYPPSWKKETIGEVMTAEKLRHISLFDFSLRSSDNDTPNIGLSWVRGRADSKWKHACSGEAKKVVQLLDMLATGHGKPKNGKIWKRVCSGGKAKVVDLIDELAIRRKRLEDGGSAQPGPHSLPKTPLEILIENLATEEGDYSDYTIWESYFLGFDLKEKLMRLNPADIKSAKGAAKILGTHRKTILDQYSDSLLDVLNHSLVDLGTKYRLLFVKRMSPAVLQGLTYLWHPGGLDAFDDHLGTLSQFHNRQDQIITEKDDLWTTNITLSHWRLLDKLQGKLGTREREIEKKENAERDGDEGKDGKKDESNADGILKRLRAGARLATFAGHRFRKQSGKDKNPDPFADSFFPPRTVKDGRTQKTLSMIREEAMSIVMTGDSMGRYWTCTVVCDLFDEVEMAKYADEVLAVLQMFIHQQYTGRLLAFVILLGHLCEKLAEQCEHFMEELEEIMHIHPMQLLVKGLEWRRANLAVEHLKEMLWGFEALSVFDDKLTKSIQKIDEAVKTMDEIGKSPSVEQIRHPDMKGWFDNTWEEFNKRYARLANAHNSISQRIVQGTRLREGSTSVLQVEQNENISMLTWVNIVYLPLAFVTGLFSAGHGIIDQNADRDTFGWIMAAVVAGTIVVALLLRTIIGWVTTFSVKSWQLIRWHNNQTATRPRRGEFRPLPTTTAKLDENDEEEQENKFRHLAIDGLRRRFRHGVERQDEADVAETGRALGG